MGSLVTSAKTRLALLTLAVGTFAIGISEFGVMGLLPNVANDLSVSIPRAGDLVTAYALGAVVGAPLFALPAARIPRKTMLIALLGLFALGNGVAALAPNIEVALGARFVAGLPHGAYFGVASVAANALVDSDKRTRAVAVVFGGVTLASIIGVPTATIIGQHTSWRAAYAMVVAVALIGIALVAIYGPTTPHEPAALRHELTVFSSVRFWLALITTMVGGAAFFASYSYIVPMLTKIAGFSPSDVSLLLVLAGVGMTAGNFLGARLADRNLLCTLVGCLAAEVIMGLLSSVVLHDKLAAAIFTFLFPATAMAVVPALQSWVIGLAGNAPNIASTAVQGAFNVANSLGPFLGGATITAGLGYNSPNIVAAMLAGAGTLLIGAFVMLSRRHTRTAAVVCTPAGPEAAQTAPALLARRKLVVGI
jgi:MFS transporter, DHA1 family, inner membrane transport protein